MTYQAPLADMGFALKYGAGLTAALEEGFFGELTMDDVEAVLGEAGRIAGEVLAPLNRIGDREGVTFKDGAVTTAPGWKEAYETWRKGGWNGLVAETEWGGQGAAARAQRRLRRNVERAPPWRSASARW